MRPDLSSNEDVLDLRAVTKVYGTGASRVEALRGVDLTIKRGEFIALVGTSGAGKSTLLNIIGCIDVPSSGDVILAGRDVSCLTESVRAKLRNKYVGFIFQSFNLIPVLNVFENVELPLLVRPDGAPQARRDRVLHTLASVGLEGYADTRPDKLSGGQRQRVAIARALIMEPALVIADEPTANLDSTTARRIIELMEELNAKSAVTFLIATHDERLMARARRILRVSDGVLLDDAGSNHVEGRAS